MTVPEFSDSDNRDILTGRNLIVPRPYGSVEHHLNPDKREFLYGSHYTRGFLGMTAGASGVMKTGLLLAEGIAMSCGRDILGDNPKRTMEPLCVVYLSGEDSDMELSRRVLAIRHVHGVGHEELEQLFFFAGMDAHEPLRGLDDLDRLHALISDYTPDVLILDPWVSLHGVEENSNDQIDAFAKGLASIAAEYGLAIEVAHHLRKAPWGVTDGATTDDARGASALKAATRSARLVAPMTATEASDYGIEDDDRWRYFHVYRDKSNLAPLTVRHWLRKQSHTLPNGDDMGVPVWWEPTPVEPDPAAVKDVTRQWEQAALEGRRFRKSSQSDDWAGHFVAECLGLDITDKRHRKAVQKILDNWEETGTTKVVQEKDGKGNPRPFYRLMRRLDKPEYPDRDGQFSPPAEVGRLGVETRPTAFPTTTLLGGGVCGGGESTPDEERDAIMAVDGVTSDE